MIFGFPQEVIDEERNMKAILLNEPNLPPIDLFELILIIVIIGLIMCLFY